MDVSPPPWGAASDTGRVREHNEDNFLAGPAIFAVADGMGGHQAGEIASEIAISVLSEIASRPDLTSDDLQAAVGQAHDQIVERSHQSMGMLGMGTTLTGVARIDVDGEPHWLVFNVGDSRVYRRTGDTLTQVSVDHSEVEELIESGIITREQARTDFRRNIITRSIGADVRPVADLWDLPASPDGQYLICSDGLTGELTDEEILAHWPAAAAPQDVAEVLVAAAVAAGGNDNVTVVVIGPLPSEPGSGGAATDGPRGVSAVEGARP